MGKKIVICCNIYPPAFIGGAELIAHQQAKTLKNLGNDVVIFTGDIQPNGKRHSVKREIYDGLIVYRVYLTPEDYQPQHINFFHKDVEESFKSLIDDYCPDVVHFHNIIGLSTGIIHIAKQKGIKTVLTLHDYWGICYKNTLMRNDGKICLNFDDCDECMPFISEGDYKGIPIRLRKDFLTLQFQDIDAFISPSSYLADVYIKAGFPREKFHVIWNGIDVRNFAKIIKKPCKDKIRFTFIGHFGNHKGIQILINAIPLIDKKDKLIVNLVGAGELMASIKKQVSEMGLECYVKFWGRIKNIEDVYRETDVLVLPSIWPENQPVSITEAMAAKIPVISSHIGGNSELVEDGRTGYLFEPGNSKDLAKKMVEFISKPEKISQMGENAYNKIASHTLENQVNKILALYEKIKSEEAGQQEEKLVVCVGRTVNPQCIWAMHKLFNRKESRSIRFVMSNWLREDQVSKAILLWVVDRNIDEKEINIYLLNEVPLLVPLSDQRLVQLCKVGNCGLYYENSMEAEECIIYIANNKSIGKVLGKNGKKMIESIIKSD